MELDSNPTIEIMTVKDLAIFLKTSETTVRRIISSGKISYRKINGGIRFYKDDIFEYLEKSKIETIS